jgi:hypothetical protein
MPEIPLFGTSGILVRAYNRAIHEMDFPFDFPPVVSVLLHFLEDPFPQTPLPPPVEASIDRLPRPVPFGQISPGRSGIQDPQDAINDPAMICSRSACFWLLRRKQRFDLLPLLIRQFVSVCHILNVNR